MCVCICTHMHTHIFHSTCLEMIGQLVESFLFFHHVGLKIELSSPGLMASVLSTKPPHRHLLLSFFNKNGKMTTYACYGTILLYMFSLFVGQSNKAFSGSSALENLSTGVSINIRTLLVSTSGSSLWTGLPSQQSVFTMVSPETTSTMRKINKADFIQML